MTRKHRRSVRSVYQQDQRPKEAVALGYDPQKDVAPRVLAAGKGLVAEKIIAEAQRQGIMIRDDPFLAAALSTVDIGTLIPPELYALVAEVLAYVSHVQEKHFGDAK